MNLFMSLTERFSLFFFHCGVRLASKSRLPRSLPQAAICWNITRCDHANKETQRQGGKRRKGEREGFGIGIKNKKRDKLGPGVLWK
jgi:hypothetical protein